MKTPDGTISECTCTDLGDCVLKGMTCTPNTYFCRNDDKCYCNSDGTIGTCQTCPDFCSNGKCCSEICVEQCSTECTLNPDNKFICEEICIPICSKICS